MFDRLLLPIRPVAENRHRSCMSRKQYSTVL